MSPTPSLGELLLAMRRKLAGRSQMIRLRDQLSATQFEALWFVAASDSVPMESVANHLGIKPPSATALISALERKGYVVRKGSPADRRVVNVALTASAKRQLTSIKKRKDKAFESLLSKLSAADRKEFTRLLILLTEE